MKSRRWVENVLVIAGVLSLDVWIWSNAGNALYQGWENRVFNQEVHYRLPAPASPAPLATDKGLVGRLSIPRLHLSAMVREGAGEETLSLALGHIPHTALPGQPGNVGIAGHRDRLFRGLRNIRRDDLIVLETLEGKYVYQVKSTSIVRPQDTSVLNAGQHSELTLVTCYPFYYVGSAPQRFIVKALEIPPSSRTLAAKL